MNVNFSKMFFLFVLLSLVFLWRSLDEFYWNRANVFSNLALSESGDDLDTLLYAQQSAKLFAIFPNKKEAKERLIQMFELQWKSASALEETGTALDAYQTAHILDETIQNTRICSPSPKRIEAENFDGVLPDTVTAPRVVDDRLVAWLFSTPPITQSICLPLDGLYQISVVSRENNPAPIEIRIVWDGWEAGVLSYAQGNERWSSQAIKIASPAGIHELQLNFQNDFSDPVLGIDRNAMIDYVEIELLD